MFSSSICLCHFLGLHPANREEAELGCIARDLDSTVLKKSREDETLNGMGSTLIGVILRNNRVYWVHVGDSRLYHFSGGNLTQVTQDQTLARFLLVEGEIIPEQLSDHYIESVVNRVI